MKATTNMLFLKYLGILVALQGLAAASLPFYDGFETYPAGTSLTNGPNGWGGTANGAVVQTNVVWSSVLGTNAASVPPDAVVSNMPVSSLLTNVWLDFYVTNSVSAPAGSFTPEDVNTNMAVEWYVETNGYPVVWHSASNAWLVCSNDYWGTPVASINTNPWMRFTVCENFSNATAAFFLNQHLLLEKVRFINSNLQNSALFQIIGGHNGTSYVDEVSARYAPTNMTADMDNDGMSDWQEIQTYGNVDTIRRLWMMTATTNLTDGGNGGGWPVEPATNVFSVPWTMVATNLQWNASNGFYAAEVLTNGINAGPFTGFDTNYASYVYSNSLSDATVTVAFARMPVITTSVTNSGGPGGAVGTITVSTNTVYPGGQVTVSLTAGVAYAAGAVNTNGSLALNFGGQTLVTNGVIAGIWSNMNIQGVFAYTGIRLVPGNYGTIQAAMAASLPGDTIFVGNGSYSGGVVLSNGVSLIGTNANISGGLTVDAGTTGTLSGCSGIVVDSTIVSGHLVISNGTVNLGMVSFAVGGAIEVVNATSLAINGSTLSGSFTLDASWSAINAQTPPFSDNFESYICGAHLSQQGNIGWAANAGVVVETNNVWQGSNAVVMPVNTILSNMLAPAALSNVWVEWNFQDAARIDDTTVDMDPRWTNMAVVLFINTNGYVTVFDPQSNAFTVVSNDVWGHAVTPVATSEWPRIALNLNYKDRMAAVMLNGRLVKQQLQFINTNQANCARLEWDAGTVGATYLDALNVWTNGANVTSGDLNANGVSDAVEVDRTGYINTWLRGSIFKIR